MANQLAEEEIAQLLLRSGLITPAKLADALALSAKMRLPLSRVLDMHGDLQESTFECAGRIHTLIENAQISLQAGLKTLELVGKQGLSLQMALARVTGAMPSSQGQTSPLGEILRRATIINEDQLDQALRLSVATSLPLGQVLINMNYITPKVLSSALIAQRLIRDGKLAEDHAIHSLRASRMRSSTFEQTLVERTPDHTLAPQVFGLEELLLTSQVLSETELASAKELELIQEKPFNQVLLDQGLIAASFLNAAHQLINMIGEGLLFEDQAAQLLRTIIKSASTDQEISQILSDFEPFLDTQEDGIEITELLQHAGLLTSMQISAASSIALETRTPLLKVLLDTNHLSTAMICAAKDCKHYLDTQQIQMEQAVIAMLYSLEYSISVTETLSRFGWSVIDHIL